MSSSSLRSAWFLLLFVTIERFQQEIVRYCCVQDLKRHEATAMFVCTQYVHRNGKRIGILPCWKDPTKLEINRKPSGWSLSVLTLAEIVSRSSYRSIRTKRCYKLRGEETRSAQRCNVAWVSLVGTIRYTNLCNDEFPGPGVLERL